MMQCPKCNRVSDNAFLCECGYEFDGTESKVSPLPTTQFKNKKATLSELLSGLKWYEQIWAGLPMLLLFIGGGVGGLCGGIAFTFNVKIFKSRLAKPAKYMLAVLITLGAFFFYLVTGVLLVRAFPSLNHHGSSQ